MKITIYNKMMFGFTIIILLMFVVNGYILIELETVTETTTNVLTYDVQSIDLAKQLQVVLDDQERYVQKYLVAGDTTY